MSDTEARLTLKQGCVLSVAELIECGILKAEVTDAPYLLVASHDCDIARPSAMEPKVEVFPCRTVELLDGNYAGAKNVRTLHLLHNGEGAQEAIELNAIERFDLEKQSLLAATLDTSRRVDTIGRSALCQWLSIRYHRAAFPDEFEARLSAAKIQPKIRKILKGTEEHILALYFDLGEYAESELGPKEIYDLLIVVVFDPSKKGSTVSATKVRGSIEELFKEKFCTTKGWSKVEVASVEIISSASLTYDQIRFMQKWHVDDMSFSGVSDGETVTP